MRFKALFLASFASVFCCGSYALDVDYENDGLCGLPPTMVKESRWQTKKMTFPKPVEDKDRIWTGPDFFTAEFGRPCVFTEDWIKQYGYANEGYKVENGFLSFKTGEKGFSFGFGPKPGDLKTPSLRVGSAWDRNFKDELRLKLVMEQDVPLTEWSVEFPTRGAESRTFQVKGKELQTVEANVFMVRNLGYCDGFKLVCKTPGAEVKIKSVWLAPTSVEMFFRKTFDLAEAPASAPCSFLVTPNSTAPYHTLYVNGVKVDTGNFIYPGGQLWNVDLTPYLKKGVNCLAYEGQFRSWGDSEKPEFVFEGVAIDKDAKLTRLLGDSLWKCSLTRQAGWEQPSFDDSKWLSPKLSDAEVATPLITGKKVPFGINPRHMGLLQCGPADGRKYPLFEVAEGLKLKASMPASLKESATVTLALCEGGTDKVLEQASGSAFSVERGLASALFTPKTREAGAYRLVWTLFGKAGEELDKRVDEAVLVGPVKQDFLKLSNFDQEFEKRLKLVTKIDCAKPVETGLEFVDHSGFRTPEINSGKIVTRNGLTYRETGVGECDYFAYRLHLQDRGEPHIAEIVIPDDAMRYIYAGTMESYPVGMCFNPPNSPGNWITATGSCYTGLRCPLTGTKRVLRFVFYPASRNAAIFVMSHFPGFPAAAVEINIYKVEGGLPALEIPPTDRMFGAHHERLSTMQLTTGMCEQPLMFDRAARLSPRDDGWFQAYKMFERKIQLLRFRGENMSVEGVFMYRETEYPSLKHSPWTSTDEMDPVALLVKMYNANNINCMLGFEYFESPDVWVKELGCPVSDRKMRLEGAPSTRLVDRHGRQFVGYMNNGYNFLNPQIGGIMLDCVSEIYDRYSKAGKIAGFFMVSGQWWLPTFNTGAYPELSDMEVGFDDLTIARFEKETGVKLGIDPRDPERFEKRYQVITTEQLPLWKLWRAKKMKEFFDEIGKRVARNPEAKWKIYSYAGTDMGTDARTEEWNRSPFKSGTREARDGYILKRLTEAGIPPHVFKESPSFVRPSLLLGLGNYSQDPGLSYDHVYGLDRSASSVSLRNGSSALYFSIAAGLDERTCHTELLKRWIGKMTGNGVFIARGIEDNAFYELAFGLKLKRIPRVIFDNWHDCNLETAFDSQMRRFTKSFYATPDTDFEPLPESACHGVFGQIAKLKDGATILRLTNDTPWMAEGFFSADAEKVVDMVYDNTLDTEFFGGGKRSVAMKPNDIRLFRLEGLKGSVSCSFELPKEVSEQLRKESRFILTGDRELLRKVPGDLVASLYAKLKDGDDYGLFQLMNDFEIVSNVKTIKAMYSALENQKLLLSDLETAGVARINYGSRSVYVDPQGARWLPDQPSITNCDAYGQLGGSLVERGDMEIKGTDKPRIYQTELYGGRIVLRIPLPDGNYNLRLHFAETFSGNKAPDRRNIALKIQGKSLPELVDPFKEAGWGTAFVKRVNNVNVSDRALVVELAGSVEINGIEIEKVK